MLLQSSLEENKNKILYKINKAAKLAGRNSKKIQLIAVTKGFSKEIWEIALNMNLNTVGESRVLEARKKKEFIKNNNKLQIHLIGHLQSNKTKIAINIFNVIQTIDSIKLANQINIICSEINKKQNIFLQINTGEDPAKFGFSNYEILKAAETISNLKNIRLIGLMTIPPINLSKTLLKDVYRKTRQIRDQIHAQINKNCQFLSMGMSNDYEIAILEGATHIRIGTALFGTRP